MVAAGRDTRYTWFSLEDQWEPASDIATWSKVKSVHDLGNPAHPSYGWGFVRIGVEARILAPWKRALLCHGVDPIELINHAEFGRHCGSDPEKWMVHLGEVRVRKWCCVDQWDGAAWRPPPVMNDRRYWWSAPEEEEGQQEGESTC